MQVPTEAVLARIFLGEGRQGARRKAALRGRSCSRRARCVPRRSDRRCAARWASAATATCTRPRSCASSADLPMIVELVDAEARGARCSMPSNRSWAAASVTLERVQVIRYGSARRALEAARGGAVENAAARRYRQAAQDNREVGRMAEGNASVAA